MAGSAAYHDDEAVRLAAVAEGSISRALDEDVTTERMQAVAQIAQAAATLALAHRTAEQTAALGQYLGDDSHLDGLKVTLRDISDGFAAGQP